MALAQCATHAIIDAEIGPCSVSEMALARELVSRLTPGMLMLADRGFYGLRLWVTAFLPAPRVARHGPAQADAHSIDPAVWIHAR